MTNKVAINTYLLTITLNTNGLNGPIKTHSVWMDNQTRPLHRLSTRDSLQIERHTETESKRVENIFYENENKQKRLK